MKKITLLIDDDVYRDLKNTIGIRMLTGNAYGVQDAFVKKLIESVDNNEVELELKYKNKD